MTEILRPSRRAFIGSLFAAIAAPAIVKVANIMPVKALTGVVEAVDYDALEAELRAMGAGFEANVQETIGGDYAQISAVTRKAFLPRLYVQTYKSNPLLLALLEQKRPTDEMIDVFDEKFPQLSLARPRHS